MLNQWIEDLQSADGEARPRALEGLRQLGPAARAAVPALMTALEKAGDDRHLACAIAQTLGAIGPDARAAVPLLTSRLQPEGTRDACFAFAILNIGGEV